MNERIKELASQLGEPSTWGRERQVRPGFAGSRWSGWSDFREELNGYNTPLYDTEQLEKFAELIVRECVKLQYKNVVVGGVSDYNRGRRELTEDIQKHFGVEE
jgi:hypothetical protein